MKTTVVELGTARKVTRDFSGAFAWDSLTYSFLRFWVWW